jgi:hypothetical protein
MEDIMHSVRLGVRGSEVRGRGDIGNSVDSAFLPPYQRSLGAKENAPKGAFLQKSVSIEKEGIS